MSKKKVMFCGRVDDDIVYKVDSFCAMYDIPKQEFLQSALEEKLLWYALEKREKSKR